VLGPQNGEVVGFEKDGSCVGCTEGSEEGDKVGTWVVGLEVGTVLGDGDDGSYVGISVGERLGEVVLSDGEHVGEADG